MPLVRRVVRRQIVDAGRRRIRQSTREVALGESAVTFAAPDTNRRGEESAQAEALRAAVEGLPRGQREAIELLKPMVPLAVVVLDILVDESASMTLAERGDAIETRRLFK